MIFGVIFGGLYFFFQSWKRSLKVQQIHGPPVLKAPIFGAVIRKATIARWTRTLATMFAAGVPLVESLDSVGGACGNAVYLDATRKIQTEVSTGTSLTVCDAKCRGVSEHGDADGVDRRRIRLAGS